MAQGSRPFTAEKDDQAVDLNLSLTRRGVFQIDVDVPGWESRRTTFARIPDLPAIPFGPNGAWNRPTPFGMTCESESPPEEEWAVAHRLGLSTCRRFVSWYRGPGVYHLDALERELEAARRHGVREWLCIGDPPPFAFTGEAAGVSYSAFDFREDVWRDFVRTASTRLKGKFLGWEWLTNTEQADWVLRQWPDELIAGCRKITYFGGKGDAAGSWDYALDDLSPRPVAATLAVLASKLTGAAPLGVFQEGVGGLVPPLRARRQGHHGCLRR